MSDKEALLKQLAEKLGLPEVTLTNLASKYWRLNNLYTIEDKQGVARIMKLNESQKRVLKQYKHNRKIILKSRQQGISTLFLAYNLDSCIFRDHYSAGIQSYGIDEANKLQKRAELMWDKFPEELKKLLNISLTSNNKKVMEFSNRSILLIGNFRGDTLRSLHISELGKIASKYPEKALELKTGAFQAVATGNKITIESTAEGKSGMFYDMWMKATTRDPNRELTPLDFQPIFLSWLDDPDCQMSQEYPVDERCQKYIDSVEKELDITITPHQTYWLAAKMDELGNDFDQEYPATPERAFSSSVEGTYYSNEYSKLKIVSASYDPQLVVHSAMDLGMSDTFYIGFFQLKPDNTPVIIGEYSNSGYGLEHYRDVYSALAYERGWVFGETFVPHDIMVRELIAGKTRWQAMQQLGFNPTLVKKHKIVDGIEATRQFLKIVEIDESCTGILSSIQNYRKKFDKRLQVFLGTPEHDEFSHAADMLRYMSMGYKYNRPTENFVRSFYNAKHIVSTRSFDV